ncbi:MAG: hypothetical protein M3P98_04145 [bacterium]|nr:hypothetical protein [bacterium]
MKAFVFDPIWNKLITKGLQDKLDDAGIEVVLTGKIAPITDKKDLFEGDDERILCVNPDYVGWDLKSEMYKGIPNLKAILPASTGFEWIQGDIAREKNIPVCHIKNFSTEAVAEWAVLMMQNLARQTPRLIKDGFPLDFDKDFMKYLGVELKGKTAAIIGAGHIGTAIANRCKGLGMDVVYWSRSSKLDGIKVDLEDLLMNADVIFPTLAKNEDTTKLITDEMLESMKQSAIIVDIAHGFINQKLAMKMISEGRLFGYGLEAEPESFGKYEGNVWAAPAYAWVTDGSMQNVMEKWIENMIFASKGEYPNRVN